MNKCGTMQNNELQEGCSPAIHTIVFHSTEVKVTLMKLQCIQNLHEEIFFFHITFNEVVKSLLENDTKTKNLPNQQSFVNFSS